MTYFQVKPDFDNLRHYKNGKYAGFLVGNELYTKREREKINVKDNVFNVVEVSKNKIYWFFGARFYA